MERGTDKADPRLGRHQHASVNGLIRCTECARTFPTRGGFNRHYKTHLRPYHCESCDKHFALRSDLDRHRKRHEPIRLRFYCKVPGCSFRGTSRKDNLGKHIRTYHAGNDRSGAALQGDDVKALIKEAALDCKRRTDNTTLLTAAQRGNEVALRFLIENGADITISSDDGKTALHIGAVKGTLRLVQLLLQAGADIGAEDARGNTALHIAAYCGHAPVVRFLVEKGACFFSGNKVGYTPLHLAALGGHGSVVQILAERKSGLDMVCRKRRTPLHIAALRGYAEATRFLIDGGANLRIKTGSGKTAMQLAAMRRHETVFRLLYDAAKADPKDTGSTELLLAAIRSDDQFEVQLLLESGARVHARGGRFLRQAVSNGNKAMVKLLLDHADSNYRRRLYGDAPLALQLAASKGDQAIVRLLLQYGADVNPWGSYNLGAVHAAAAKGHAAIVKILLDHGPDADPKRTYSSALEAAAENGDEAIIRLLVGKGAHIEAALTAAAAKGHAAIVKILLDHGPDADPKRTYSSALKAAAKIGDEAIVRLLLDCGADTTEALHAAASGGNGAIVKLLLDHRPDADPKRTYGCALEAAAENGDEAIVRLLLDRGAMVNAGFGSALHAVAGNGNEAAVKLLLDMGADVNAKHSFLRTTAIEEAALKGNRVIAELLLTYNADFGRSLSKAAYNGDGAFVKMLLDHGADVNAHDGAALLGAIARGNEGVARILWDNGASLNTRTTLAEAALVLASQNGHYMQVKLLLEYGVDVNRRGGLGDQSAAFDAVEEVWQDFFTCGIALVAAAWAGHEAIVRLLLAHGADIHEVDRHHKTALDRAASKGNKGIVLLLLERGALTSLSEPKAKRYVTRLQEEIDWRRQATSFAGSC